MRYLHTAQQRHGGPVAGLASMTIFERSWVLCSLAGSGMRLATPEVLIEHLGTALGPDGAPAGNGPVPDSDDTAGVLHALALMGRPRSTACLRGYRAGRYFRCFIGERTPSTSANAHVLDALLDDVALDAWHRHDDAVDTAAGWLLDRQESDGSWQDKWHASRYYATVCCVHALARIPRLDAADAIQRAVDWVLGQYEATLGLGHALVALLNVEEYERVISYCRSWMDHRPTPASPAGVAARDAGAGGKRPGEAPERGDQRPAPPWR